MRSETSAISTGSIAELLQLAEVFGTSEVLVKDECEWSVDGIS